MAAFAAGQLQAPQVLKVSDIEFKTYVTASKYMARRVSILAALYLLA